MKQNIFLKLMMSIGIFFTVITGCFAQTATRNYTTTYIPQVAVTNEWAIPGLAKEAGLKIITYYDGLGRKDQVIQASGSPTGYDIVTPIKYDAFGREVRKFLPYTVTTANSGAFVAADSISQSSYYTGLYGSSDGTNAFSKTEFEPSPLNRILKQGAPGATWQPNTVPTSDRSVKCDYGTNNINEVRRWTIVNNALTDNGFYAPKMLYRTITWDGNHKQDTTVSRTIEYKDLQGKVVLKVACNDTMKFSTYYIYDNLERLRLVIPPKANYHKTVTSSVLDSLCYQYRYDARGRMVMKKIPGADSTIMVYDARDRLALSQNGVQRLNHKWFFTKYDEIDRPVITGRISLGVTSADTLRAQFARYTNTLYESKVSGGNWGYSLNNSYPSTVAVADTNILGINYYDNYTHLTVTGFAPTNFNKTYNIDTDPDNDGNNDGYFDNVKGQVTGTKVKVLDGNEYTSSAKWLCSANYYNDRYRIIQNKQTLYSGGTVGADTLIVSNLYDFMGKVLQTKQVQTFNSVTTIVDKYYAFDHLARLTTSSQQITGDATNGKVTVALNTYNESGQLIDKKLHGANSLGYLQYVDYTYNIRGWLTSINNPDNLSHLTDPVDLFGERLDYDATEIGLNSSYGPQYNGNVSGMVWTSTNKTKRGYAFTYDGLNRLTYGDFKGYNSAWVDSTNYEEKSLSYDQNGNINRLVRTNSSGGTMADYTYHYKGNQLDHINSLTAYSYDKNGNATLDGLRGFIIAYNSLNLPNSITSGTDNIAYIYSAAGTKLAKKMKDNTYQYYAGNMVYKNDKSLNYLLFGEGLVNKVSGGYAYEYHIKDHLGNTRIAFQPNGSTVTVTQVAEYYPFGSSYLPISPVGTNKYLYGGKEEQDDVLGTGSTVLDNYDFGTRFYDPQIGRWNVMDRLAENYNSVSPYQYCVNNPLNYTDPSGNSPILNDKSLDMLQYQTYLHNKSDYGTRIGDIGDADNSGNPAFDSGLYCYKQFQMESALNEQLSELTTMINDAIDAAYTVDAGGCIHNDGTSDIYVKGSREETGQGGNNDISGAIMSGTLILSRSTIEIPEAAGTILTLGVLFAGSVYLYERIAGNDGFHTSTRQADSWENDPKIQSYRNYDDQDPFIPPGVGVGPGIFLFVIGLEGQLQDFKASLNIDRQIAPADATRVEPVIIFQIPY